MGPVKYTRINGIKTKLLDIPYLKPSLEIQDPKKRFKVTKCSQKTNKKDSVLNTVKRFSKLKYNLKTLNIDSSNGTI